MNRFMDTLTAKDAAHRLAAQTSSDNLLQAILAARAGTCVVTPTKPLKLPPDSSAHRKAGEKGGSAIPAPETQSETALRLFSKGQSEKSIARDMGLANHQLVQNILRRVKRDTPSIYWRAVDRHMAARGIIR